VSVTVCVSRGDVYQHGANKRQLGQISVIKGKLKCQWGKSPSGGETIVSSLMKKSLKGNWSEIFFWKSAKICVTSSVLFWNRCTLEVCRDFPVVYYKQVQRIMFNKNKTKLFTVLRGFSGRVCYMPGGGMRRRSWPKHNRNLNSFLNLLYEMRLRSVAPFLAWRWQKTKIAANMSDFKLPSFVSGVL